MRKLLFRAYGNCTVNFITLSTALSKIYEMEAKIRKKCALRCHIYHQPTIGENSVQLILLKIHKKNSI